MKITKYVLFSLLIITAIMITACEDDEIIENGTDEPVLGADEDEYGCKPSEGYTWCPSLDECVRTWETLCPEYEEYYKEPGACTKEYMPVEGDVTIPTTESEKTIRLKFSNRCVAETAGAENIELINWTDTEVTNFEECVEAGNPVMESHPRQCIHEGELFVEETNFEELPENKYEACQEVGGTPLEEYSECEYVSEQVCEYLGGEFKECESACRHDPEAEVCITLCVPVCNFN